MASVHLGASHDHDLTVCVGVCVFEFNHYDLLENGNKQLVFKVIKKRMDEQTIFSVRRTN